MPLLHLQVDTPHGEVAGRVFTHQVWVVTEIVSTAERDDTCLPTVQNCTYIQMELRYRDQCREEEFYVSVTAVFLLRAVSGSYGLGT